MESGSNPMQSLCRAGCGFYGNSATDGLCSVCYKEALKKKQQAPNTSSSSSTFSPTQQNSAEKHTAVPAFNPSNLGDGDGEAAACPDDSKQAVDEFENNQDEKETKKKSRCALCRKKVGLTGFECRCGGLYCGVHRYSDKHGCTFNYRELGAEEIRRNNPLIAGEKVKKI